MTELELKNKGFKKISNYFENIKDYYWVDCNGNVFTTNLDRFIIPAKDRDGYLRVVHSLLLQRHLEQKLLVFIN